MCWLEGANLTGVNLTGTFGWLYMNQLAIADVSKRNQSLKQPHDSKRV